MLMGGVLKLIVLITNNLHDLFNAINEKMGMNLSDKQLHFLVIGCIGMFIYLVTNRAFKLLAKYNIAIISFIYTFTVLMVIVFGIEVEQKITHRGNMEFADIEAGLWGFIIIFVIYLVIIASIYFIKKIFKKFNEDK